MRFQGGLSLIEVLIAVAMAGLLLALAVPSFQALQARRAAAAAIALIESDFALARSEAVKRGHSVTICASSTGTTCLQGGAAPFDWQQGWIVIPSDSTTSLLRVQGALSGIGSMRASDSQFTFRSTGIGRASAANIVVTPLADATQARRLCISFAGRLVLTPLGTVTC